MKVKYQAVDVIIPAGQSGTYTQTFELDPAYTHCNGVAAYPKKDGGILSYDIAIADDHRVYHDFVDKSDYMPGSGVAPDLRYKTLDIENAKQRFKIRVTPDAEPTSELRFQIIFRLIKAK
jgi:hypothetical protein